jgi:MFS family permease
MDTLGQSIESIMLSRPAIGVLLIALGIALAYANRSVMAEIASDPSPGWRVIARIAAALLTVTVLWTTFLDDWLQLVAEPLRLSMKWEYQRVVYDPVDPTIRWLTVGLIAATLVALALLFARHVGGYGLQLGVLVLAGIAWVPLYVMGQRMNSMVVQGAEASDTLPETLGLLAFWLVRAGLGVAAILVTLLFAMMPIALVATALLDLTGLRHPRVTHEADSFFSELGNRAGEHEDVPLRAFWRPIRRPL